jgi:hypothetical protein
MINLIQTVCDQVTEYIQTGNLSVIDFTIPISDEYIEKLNKMPHMVQEQVFISHTLFIFKFLRDKNSQ